MYADARRAAERVDGRGLRADRAGGAGLRRARDRHRLHRDDARSAAPAGRSATSATGPTSRRGRRGRTSRRWSRASRPGYAQPAAERAALSRAGPRARAAPTTPTGCSRSTGCRRSTALARAAPGAALAVAALPVSFGTGGRQIGDRASFRVDDEVERLVRRSSAVDAVEQQPARELARRPRPCPGSGSTPLAGTLPPRVEAVRALGGLVLLGQPGLLGRLEQEARARSPGPCRSGCRPQEDAEEGARPWRGAAGW